jgi:hypothetical protein
MKKFIQWLAKIFKAEITVEKIVYKDKIIYKDKIVEVIKEVEVEVVKEVEVIKYLPNPDLSDVIKYQGLVDGDLTVEGNLLVTGVLNVTGGVTCLKVVETNK